MTSLVGDYGIELIKVNPGSFLMGSDFDVVATITQKVMLADTTWASEASVEWPQHHVNISQGFYISKFPITNKIYMEVIADNLLTGAVDNPALLSWQQIESFLQKLNSKDNQFCYRLPTEAEWEYCCKAETGYEFLNSNSPSEHDKIIVNGDFIPELDSCFRPVGSSGENKWGIYDMLGNVPEWCSDFYDPDYYLNSPETDPENTTVSDCRVMRGASYYFRDYDYPVPYRSTARYPIDCSENDGLNEAQIDESDEDDDTRELAGLRLIATEKQE